jgi:hypothetical protein
VSMVISCGFTVQLLCEVRGSQVLSLGHSWAPHSMVRGNHTLDLALSLVYKWNFRPAC